MCFILRICVSLFFRFAVNCALDRGPYPNRYAIRLGQTSGGFNLAFKANIGSRNMCKKIHSNKTEGECMCDATIVIAHTSHPCLLCVLTGFRPKFAPNAWLYKWMRWRRKTLHKTDRQRHKRVVLTTMVVVSRVFCVLVRKYVVHMCIVHFSLIFWACKHAYMFEEMVGRKHIYRITYWFAVAIMHCRKNILLLSPACWTIFFFYIYAFADIQWIWC